MKHPAPLWLRVLAAVLAFFLAVGALGAVIQYFFAHNTPGLDLYVFWSAGRALLTGQNPYSPELTRAIQLGIYGHILPAGKDPMSFAYPPYMLLPIWPLLGLTFDWVEALWLSFNLLIGAVCLRLALPRLPVWALPWIYFAYPFAFGLILGNFAILISSILILCLARLFIRDESPPAWEQIGLGLLLAWTSGKPQFGWLFILVLGINAFRRRQIPFLVSLAAGLAICWGLSWVWLPGWPASWLKQLGEYAQLNPARSPLLDYLSALVPSGFITQAVMLGWVILLGASAGLIWGWLQGKIGLYFLLAFAGAVTFLLNPSGRAYDQLPYLIPLLLYANHLTPKPWVLGLVLFLLIGLSWTLFAISILFSNQAADRWMFLFYLPWLIWLGFHTRAPLRPGKV